MNGKGIGSVAPWAVDDVQNSPNRLRPIGDTVRDIVVKQKGTLDEIEGRTKDLLRQVLGEEKEPIENVGARNVDCLAGALEDLSEQAVRILDKLRMLCEKMG